MTKFVPWSSVEIAVPSRNWDPQIRPMRTQGRQRSNSVAVHVARCAGDGGRLPPQDFPFYRPPAGCTARDQSHPKPMAWRPYENLIDGELDNRKPGTVTGWMRFFRNGKRPLRVTFNLAGDFHEDIRGTRIRLSNPQPSDRCDDEGAYMEGFARVQRGTAGDITAGQPLGPWTEALAQRLMERNELIWDEAGIRGRERARRRREFAEQCHAHIAAQDLFYPYVEYPYIEWYSDNGRVVLELDPSQLEIVEYAPLKEKSAAELVNDERRRGEAFGSFLGEMVQSFSRENRSEGDSNVTGTVVS